MSNYRNESEDLSRAFKALGNPHRLAIVRTLIDRAFDCCDAEGGCNFDPATCNVGELAAAVDVAPSTTSHHLKELEAAGLIERRREGRRLLVRIEPGLLERLRRILQIPEGRTSGNGDGA